MGLKLTKEVTYESLPSYNWTNTQVCEWVKKLGLQKYVDIFSTLQIDGKQLLVLRKEDIRKR